MEKNLIIKLRERTGAGMMDCKKALIKADGNINLAQCYLRLLSQPLTRLINVKGVKRPWDDTDYMNEARRIEGVMYGNVRLDKLYRLTSIRAIKVGCIYIQNHTKKIGIIRYELTENGKYYYLGEQLIQISDDTHEYKNIGLLVLDMKEKIEERFEVLRFEFLNKITGERFGIDAEEMEDERCGGR